MSIKVPLEKLSERDIDMIEKSLEIRSTPNSFYGANSSTIIYPYSIENNKVTLPFSFAVNNLKLSPETRERTEKVSFSGTLKDYQKEVKSEAIDILNKNGSVMICMACGMGKCLGKDTLVLKANGKLEMSQYIKSGDLLMGDDSTIRTVLSTCTGREKLYRIRDLTTSYSYIVNESHILSLAYYDGKMITADIPLKSYLSFPESLQLKLFGYRVVISDFLRDNKFYKISSYKYGRKIGKYLSFEDIEFNFTDLKSYCYGSLSARESFISGFFSVFEEDDNFLPIYQKDLNIAYSLSFILRSCGYSCYISFEDHFCFGFSKEKVSPYYSISVEDIGEGEYYGFELDGNGRFVLGDFSVTHNTALSIYLSTKINLKTMILTNLEILQGQWKESILQFSKEARIQIVGTKDDLDESANYYIMNPLNVPKKKKAEYSNIGLLIADEAHLLMTPCFIKAFQYFYPRYLIGLTATPQRSDGMDILLDIYFGKERIFRDIKRDFLVYEILTGIVPSFEKDDNDKLIWNSVLISQADNESRNNIILKIISLYKDREFLVLCKRVSQADYLYDKLKDKEKVCRMYGKYKTIKDSDRIIIATIKKAGVGFNRPSLNALILAGDTQELYIQNLMRVMRRFDSQPIIFDLVDDFRPLKNHYSERKKVYLSTGGLIKTINLKKNPTFFKE